MSCKITRNKEYGGRLANRMSSRVTRDGLLRALTTVVLIYGDRSKFKVEVTWMPGSLNTEKHVRNENIV